MILKPRLRDLKSIGHYTGKIILGIGLCMILPLMLALALKESAPAMDFTAGILVSLICGLLLVRLFDVSEELTWMQGMMIVSLSWVIAMLLAAVPLYLSGHWKSFLDTCFDTMSGFATTGLSLVQDLDHLSYSHNLWRHLIMFLGGQGIVIIALSFFMKGVSGAFRMYVGEARDERILPNVVHSSRFIWIVSLVYLCLGTLALGITGTFLGMQPFNAFFHGACIFMAAFDTGGFAPQSQNILYYHSVVFELITVVIMVFGSLNFRLHHRVWNGDRWEMARNIETVSLFFTIMCTFLIVMFGLKQSGIYSGSVEFLSKGFYQLISGHTGTGFQTIYPARISADWGPAAITGIIAAMTLGGAVCSTTGAIKMLRVGIIFKALAEDIKNIIMPEKSVVVEKYHHIKDVFLEEKQVRSALMITLAYIILYAIGAIAGVLYGYPLQESLFESTSAAANVGLSCGITAPSMPAGLKVIYILQMWAGRLEFMSIFALLGFFIAAVKGK